MRLQQLRYLITIAENGFNISAAARVLNTSQPGISRQIKILEEELGLPILSRTKNSIDGLAPGAEAILSLARQIVSDVNRLHDLGRRSNRNLRRSLLITTNYSIARYLLAEPLSKFRETHPSITVEVSQNTPDVALQKLINREVDLVLNTRLPAGQKQLLCIPCYSLSRVLIMPHGHPLEKCDELTLQKISEYPLITYVSPHVGRTSVENAFRQHNVSYNIALTVSDSEFVKSCVANGLGIAIISALSFDQGRDSNLFGREVTELFEPSPVYAVVRRDSVVEKAIVLFINMFAPHVTEDVMQSLLSDGVMPEPKMIKAALGS